MNNFYITFRSVTFAQRGEKLLRQGGYRCVLQRTPRWMEEQGCGYCLKLKVEDIMPAVLILRGEKLPMRKVYLQRGDGGMEEVRV